MEIIRHYPIIRRYPYRYTNDAFDKSHEMYNDPVLTEHYNQWKKRINPRTNRKIKIGGKTYNAIKNDFMISFLYGRVFYLKLANIDEEKYKEETIQLNHETDKENEIISSTIEQINRLQHWNDYVMYDGIKYGLQKVLNHVHRENDCFGKMEYSMEKKYKCRGCMNKNVRYQCLCHTYTIHKCNKCGYEEKIDFHSTPFL